MLTETERHLLDRLNTALGTKVNAIRQVPFLSGRDLLSRFDADAPAIYGALQSGAISDDVVSHRCGLIIITRSAAGQVAAREGDAVQIGLYALVDAVLTLARCGYLQGWYADSYNLGQDAEFTAAGLTTAVISLVKTETIDAVDPALVGLDNLHAFLGISAYVDVRGIASAADHTAWLDDQPGSTSPDIVANATLEQS
jgi:hypothetical protein